MRRVMFSKKERLDLSFFDCFLFEKNGTICREGLEIFKKMLYNKKEYNVGSFAGLFFSNSPAATGFENSFAEKRGFIMKTKYYLKLLFPLSLFGALFRVLEILFAVDAHTSLFLPGSIIPTVFNIYCVLVTLFFLSGLIFLPERKQKSPAGYASFDPPAKFLFILAAVLILSLSLYEFVTEFFAGKISSAKALFTSLPFYLLVCGIIAALYYIQLAVSPERIFRNMVFKFFALALPIFYTLVLFDVFLNGDPVIIRVYEPFDVVRTAAIVLAMMSFAKLCISQFSRRNFVVYAMIAAFYSSIRFADLVLFLFPSNPYNISMRMILLCDIFVVPSFFVLIPRKQKKKMKAEREN